MVVVMQGRWMVLHSHHVATQLMGGQRLTAEVQVSYFSFVILK